MTAATGAGVGEIGPYDLLGEVGAGGGGIVYRARHREKQDVVALKTVHATQVRYVSGVRRELWALRSLPRRGVVRLLDSGTVDGRPWYAMEFIDGPTLAEVLGHAAGHTAATLVDSAQLPEQLSSTPVAASRSQSAVSDRRATLLTLVRRVAETLASLHGEGIVHRDVKPSNVMLRPDGTPVLMDFGLVRRFSTAGREVLDIADVAGTVGYMAPEQARGDRTDARADLYALGCVLYECVVGRPPFVAPTKAQLLALHATAAPVPPSTLAVDVPPSLDDLLGRLLAKRPRDRIGYAGDVADALAALGAQGWDPPEPRVQPSRPYWPELAGRDSEVERMKRLVTGLSSHRGSFVLVDGESGIGKTAFVTLLGQVAAQHGFTVVTGECERGNLQSDQALTGQGGPLHPFRSMLETIADYCVERGAATTSAILGDRGRWLAPYEPTLATLRRPIPEGPAVPVASELGRGRVVAALRDCMIAFARHRPLVVILDDLQWCDELSVEVLRSLANEDFSNTALLIVGTSRSDERTPFVNEVARWPGLESVHLERLDRAALERMAADMLAIAALPPDLATALWEVSAGHPFFVAECLRTAMAEGLLVRERSSWRPATLEPSLGVLRLPRSIDDLIRRRLASLDDITLQILNLAAVLGRDIEPTLLGQAIIAANIASWTDVDGVVHTLVERQLLEEDSRGRLRFVHDKVRSHTYDRIEPARVRALHGAVAETLEARQAGDLAGDSDETAAVIGRHFAAAGLPQRAIPHLRRGSDRARSAHANQDALALYDLLLSLLSQLQEGSPEDGHWRSEIGAILECRGDVHMLIGNVALSRQSYSQALDCGAQDESPVRATFLRKIGRTWAREHRHDEALQSYASAEQVLRGDSGERTAAWWGGWLDVQNDRIWSYYWSARLLEMADAVANTSSVVDTRGSAAQRAAFYQSLTLLHLRKERYRASDITVAHARTALDAQTTNGDPWQIPLFRFGLAFVLLLADKLAESEGEFDVAVREAARIGDQTLTARLLAYLAILHRKLGRVGEATALAQKILTMPASGQLADYHGVANANLGWAAWRRGDEATAAGALTAAVEAWRRPPAVFPFRWLARAPLLAMAVEAGNAAEATDHLREMLADNQQCLSEPLKDLANDAVENKNRAFPRRFRPLLVRLREEGWL